MKEKEIGDIACDVNRHKFSTLKNKVISIGVTQKLRIASIKLITFKNLSYLNGQTVNKY